LDLIPRKSVRLESRSSSPDWDLLLEMNKDCATSKRKELVALNALKNGSDEWRKIRGRKTPAVRRATKSKCCGVDGGDAAFDSDAVYLHGFGEDRALKTIWQDFQYRANFGRVS